MAAAFDDLMKDLVSDPIPEDESPPANDPLASSRAQLLTGRPESLTLEQMLKRFVHVARGPLIVDVSNTYRRLRPGEFSAAYAHNKVIIEKKAVPVTRLWEQSGERMVADCLAFHPGEAQFYVERGLRHLNIWAPPTWPVSDPKAAAPFLEHSAYLIPDARQRNDLLDWLAHAAQHPEVRPHFHFLLVAAKEGTGRSWLVEVLRRLWGERLVAIDYSGRYKSFSLTAEGAKLGAEELAKVDGSVRDFLRATADWVRGLRFDQLVAAIYREYPEMKVNSVFNQ